jgi:hypothetical protein
LVRANAATRLSEGTTDRAAERDATASCSRAAAWLASHGEPIDDLAALAFHLRARAVLGRILARLDAVGIPALVVKGAVLAHTLYPSPIDRPIRDVDLRVRPADLRRAADVLAESGGRRLVSSHVYGNAVLSYERVEVDLESTVGPPYVCALGVGDLLARAERTTAGLGFWHLRPELHDHVLLLAVNLFKDHVVEVPRWRLRDLELAALAPGFDPDALAARAEEARCCTIVHVIARHLAEACGDARWEAVARRVPPTRARYAAHVLATLQGERRPSTLAWRLEARAASDGRARCLAAVAASAMREAELAIERAASRRRRRQKHRSPPP